MPEWLDFGFVLKAIILVFVALTMLWGWFTGPSESVLTLNPREFKKRSPKWREPAFEPIDDTVEPLPDFFKVARPAPGEYAKHRCPNCTGPNNFLEWRQTVDVSWKFVPGIVRRYEHDYRCRRCGHEFRWETKRWHPDHPPRNLA